MADLLTVVKQAAMSAVSAGNPTAVLFGTVMSASPLEVMVDQRFRLSAGFLIVPESLIHYELDEQQIVIRRGLEAGDAVILLRVQGGQRFVILDRVGAMDP